MKKAGDILVTVLFSLILLLGGLGFVFAPKADYSLAERRPLAGLPEVTPKSLLSGDAFDGFSAYVTDRFPPREFWRSLKARWQLCVLRETENNSLALFDGSIVRLEKQVNEASFSYAAERLGGLYDRYLKHTDCRVYAAVVPDKSVFLKEAGYPVAEFSEVEKAFAKALPFAKQISLSDTLTLGDYYRTDSHWRQEKLLPAAEKLLTAMGAPAAFPEDLAFNDYSPFLGLYAGFFALPTEAESIVYLTGGFLDELTAADPATREVFPVYDPAGCDPRDPYTLFSGGNRALVRIENPNAGTDRELTVFRDSFASSIAPLLAAGYKSVTLVDPRYISPEAIGRYLRFTGGDVLFLFSFTLLNDSHALR